MSKARLNLLLLLALLLPSSASPAAQTSPKPIVNGYVFVDYDSPPPTIVALANLADVVTRATVSRARSGILHGSLQTECTVTLAEVLKSDRSVAPGSVVIVQREGGDLELADHIQRTINPSFAPFRVGDAYVLFLQWNSQAGNYRVFYGPDGAFHISGGILGAMGHSRVSTDWHGHAFDQLKQTLAASGLVR